MALRTPSAEAVSVAPVRDDSQRMFSYRSNAARTPSVVAVNLKPASDNATTIEIEHSNLSSDIDRGWALDRWSAALERIESDCL